MTSDNPGPLMAALNLAASGKPLGDTLRGHRIGVTGATTLADSLRCAAPATLHSLDLYDTGLTDAGAAALVQMLCQHDHATPKRIDLGANQLSVSPAALAPLLRARPSMSQDSSNDDFCVGGVEELRLARNAMDGGNCAALLNPLPADLGHLSLTCLALSFNALGSAGGRALGDCLSDGRLPALRSLQLCCCGLGSTGASSIAVGLRSARSLTHLDLCDNEVADVGAHALAAEMPHARLEELLLARNGLSDRSGQILATALGKRRKCSLRTLVLASNGLRDASAIAFANVLSAPRPRGNRSLAVLDLSANKMGMSAVVALGDTIVANSSLTVLNLARNERIDVESLAVLEGLLAYNRPQAAASRHMKQDALVAPNVHASQLATRAVQHLFTSELLNKGPRPFTGADAGGCDRWNGARQMRTHRSSAAAEALETVTRQSEEMAAARSALSAAQDNLSDASITVATLRLKEATLRRALHSVASGSSII